MKEESEALETRVDGILRELAPLADIPLQIAIEVGRLRLRVRELVKLAPDTIVPLKKPAGEPFDICINGMIVGRGEIYAMDQATGIRVVEIQRSGSSAL
jgi:flagellar motor switch protein FliN